MDLPLSEMQQTALTNQTGYLGPPVCSAKYSSLSEKRMRWVFFPKFAIIIYYSLVITTAGSGGQQRGSSPARAPERGEHIDDGPSPVVSQVGVSQ